MQYDFDTPVNRFNTNSLKWDVAKNELPMWVADMDFLVAPEIKNAVLARAEHGLFGYTSVPDAWYNAYISWWHKRHSLVIEKDWLIFCTGVVPAISSLVRKLTTPAESVLIQTPVYNIFFNSILNNGCLALQSPLNYDGANYSINFADLEQKLSSPQTTLMLLCNPHNPVGRLWDKSELAKIGALCAKHSVIVISDEIHADLTDPEQQYVPFASVSSECRENSITCISPSKAFNLAGLQTAAVVIPNAALRHKAYRALNTDEVAEPNAFAIDATIAAFTKGDKWLDALREYLYENKKLVASFIKQELPKIKLVESKATYLLWLDCSQISGSSQEIAALIRERTGLYLSHGSQFGACAKQFLRMNIACPKSVLEDGLKRLRAGLSGL